MVYQTFGAVHRVRNVLGKDCGCLIWSFWALSSQSHELVSVKCPVTGLEYCHESLPVPCLLAGRWNDSEGDGGTLTLPSQLTVADRTGLEAGHCSGPADGRLVAAHTGPGD